MHPSVTAVYRRLNPIHPDDQKLWSPSEGVMAEKKHRNRKRYHHGLGLFHGMDAWASIYGRSNRMRVKFDEILNDFPFPEEFRQRLRLRKEGGMFNRKSRKREIDAAYYKKLSSDTRAAGVVA